MKLKLECHLLAHDSESFLHWAIRHWQMLGARVVVHDGGPSGGSTKIAESSGAEARSNDSAGQLNDELNREKKNSCWKGSDADWVTCCDADELLWWPEGMQRTLESYERLGAAVIKPHGFEMFSETWFDPSEHTGQITDWVKYGAPDDKWYAKPILFSPKRVAESAFGVGAHESEPILKDGRRLKVDGKWPKANPPTYLCHFHGGYGPVEHVAKTYAENRKRLSAINVRMKWGNFEDPMKHAMDKRAAIMPNLRRVIA